MKKPCFSPPEGHKRGKDDFLYIERFSELVEYGGMSKQSSIIFLIILIRTFLSTKK